MKRVLFLLSFFVCMRSEAQLFKEFFRQDKTQIEYLVKQVAGLRTQINALKEGYAILQEGLQFLGDIRSGEFELHQHHFDALPAVHPLVRSSPVVQEIHRLHGQIDKVVKRVPDDAVIRHVLNDHEELMSECRRLMTHDVYRLTDAERLALLEKMKKEMMGQYHYLRSYIDNTIVIEQLKKK